LTLPSVLAVIVKDPRLCILAVNWVTPPTVSTSGSIVTIFVSDDVNDLYVKGRISDGTGEGVSNCGALKLNVFPVTNVVVLGNRFHDVNGFHDVTNVGVPFMIVTRILIETLSYTDVLFVVALSVKLPTLYTVI